MITRDMIENGYEKGIVKLIFSPNSDGIVCSIGENWFYFGGKEAADYDDVNLYKQDIPKKAIIDMIYDELQSGFLSGFLINGWEEMKDEYDYYEAYLRESLGTKIAGKKRVFISLPMAGKSDEEILTDISDAKTLYLEEHPDEDVEFVDGFVMSETPKVPHPELTYLGHSIAKMCDCDDVIFYGDWRKARGCIVERLVYDLYFAS